MSLKTQTVRIYISDMTCIGCQNRIEKKLNTLRGVKSATVSYRNGSAEITYRPDVISPQEISAAVKSLGYTVVQKKPPAPFLRTVLLSLIIIVLFALLDHFGILNLLVPSQLADSSMGLGMLFVIGLITSVHCVAMCGGINLSQCLPKANGDTENSSHTAALLPALMYNLGRVISYTVTGFILGLVGMLIGGAGTGISPLLQGILKIAAGVFMVIMGLGMLDLFPGMRKVSIHMPRFLSEKIGKKAMQSSRPLIVGLLNGLMPCGPLQSMQIVALASGDPLTGAVSMLLFSLGTVPLMLGLGSLISVIGRRSAHAVTTVGSVLVVVLGLAMLSQGGNLSGFFTSTSLLALAGALAVVAIVSALPYKKTQTRKVCTALSLCICVAAVAAFALLRQPEQTVSSAEIVDGVQIVHSTLQPGSYPDITVNADMPVRWIIDAPQGSINGCNNRILIHEYGIEYTFKSGENIIEFVPDKAGSFSYSCWMGMIHGKISVIK